MRVSRWIYNDSANPWRIVLDFNADKQVVGIEFLRLKQRVPSADLKQLQFEVD